MKSSGIAQGHDDRSVDVLGHFFDYCFREGFWFGRSPNEDMWLHFSDD